MSSRFASEPSNRHWHFLCSLFHRLNIIHVLVGAGPPTIGLTWGAPEMHLNHVPLAMRTL